MAGFADALDRPQDEQHPPWTGPQPPTPARGAPAGSGKQRKQRKLSKTEQQAVVKEVRDRIQEGWEHERINIVEAILDQRFLANDQWPDAARRQREQDGRPILTFNRLIAYLHQTVNPIRQADKTIRFKPDDDTQDATLAKVCDGISRKIMRQSQAHSVFAHVLNCQAGCSIGWLRVCHDYKSDDSFDQEIFIEKIDSPISVFWDPAARDPVFSDAMWMCVTELIPEATFRRRWPDAGLDPVDDPAGLGNLAGVSQSGFYWRDNKDVRVAEYYRKVPTKRMLAKLLTGQILDITNLTQDHLATFQSQIAATRSVSGYRVEKFLVNGVQILEGPTDVPGTFIPLVPAKGGEIALDRGIYRYSVIRFSRDAQQMYNLARTSSAEWIGQAPKAPWLATPKQVMEHRQMWETQSTRNRNLLLYTPDEKAGGPPQRIAPPTPNTALVEESQQAATDMQYGSNLHNASLGAPSNEVSGVAIEQKQQEGDVSNYHFSDNFKATLQHVGVILNQWIPVIYDTQRQMLLIAPDGKEHLTPINTPQIGPDGRMVIVNDLTAAKFAVEAEIGPSYTTRRDAANEELGQFMHAIPPQQAALITDIYARNQDWEGHEEIANRLRASIPPQIIQGSQTGPNGQPIPQPPPQPPPMMIAQLEKIAAEIEDIRAKAAERIVNARAKDHQHQLNLAMLPGLMDPGSGQPGAPPGGQLPPPGAVAGGPPGAPSPGGPPPMPPGGPPGP